MLMTASPLRTTGWDEAVGLYLWIGVGVVVGVASRLLANRRVKSDVLESILMGIAGAVVGGWIGARIRNAAGIDDVSVLAVVTAFVGALMLDSVFLYSRRRHTVVRSREEHVQERGKKAA